MLTTRRPPRAPTSAPSTPRSGRERGLRRALVVRADQLAHLGVPARRLLLLGVVVRVADRLEDSADALGVQGGRRRGEAEQDRGLGGDGAEIMCRKVHSVIPQFEGRTPLSPAGAAPMFLSGRRPKPDQVGAVRRIPVLEVFATGRLDPLAANQILELLRHVCVR